MIEKFKTKMTHREKTSSQESYQEDESLDQSEDHSHDQDNDDIFYQGRHESSVIPKINSEVVHAK